MRIVFLIPGFGGGGAEKQCLFLLKAMHGIGADVKVIYFQKGVYHKLLDELPLKKIKLEAVSFYNPINIYKLYKVLKVNDFDILFTWLPISDIYGFFLKLIFSKKWVVAERDSKYKKNFRNLLREFLVKFSDGIIANSEQGILFWKKRSFHKKLIFIPNILGNYELPVINPEINKLNFLNKTLLYVGRFEEKKRVVELAMVFKELLEVRDDIDILMVGGGAFFKEVQSISQNSKFPANFQIIDFQENIYSYYQKSDLFLSFSEYEGMPNTLIESIYFEVLPVVTSLPENKYILGLNYPFFIENVYDIKSCIEKIIFAIEELPNKNKYLNFGKSKLNDYQPNIIAKKYFEAFESLL